MPFIEITGYIDSPSGANSFPFTLKKSKDSGYFLLNPFLPLLKQLNEDKTEIDVDELRTDLESIDNSIPVELQDLLLSKFGVLVDTDESGDRWITKDKAYELLSMINISQMFENQFDIENSNTVETGEKQQNEENLSEKEKTPDDININTEQGDNKETYSQDELLEKKRSTENLSQLKSGEYFDKTKRSQDLDLDIKMDSHRELGSPLKKIKYDASSANPAKEDGNDDKRGQNGESNVSKPFAIFSHDLTDEFLKLPLELHKAITFEVDADNNQRVKLESFLQKLLFPDAKNVEDENQNFPTFELLLNEIEQSFPNIELNLNIPVDEHGNTPLHWLTSIANIDLVKDLVRHGSNRLVCDNMGESALVKAVKSVNNYDSGTFEELLDYLYPCLILEDSMNRSILHHIIITSGMTGCSSAAKYYLDILMGWIVKQPTREVEGGKEKDVILQNLDLKWVISNMLNAQDSNGDTCLNIAARLGNVPIVDALLDYGADPYIPNKSGLRPIDFGAGTSKLNPKYGTNNSSTNDSEIKDEDMAGIDDNKTILGGLSKMKKPETDGLINDIKSLLSAVSKDYELEVSQHNEKLEKLRKDLVEQRQKLSISRESLVNAKQLRDQYNLLKEQLKNIQDGIQAEEENFREESQKLGISAEETSGIDWESSEFDADEPFRVEFIYNLLEDKLNSKYDGDIDRLIAETDVDAIVKEIEENYGDNEDKIDDMLPPAVLLKARINAYKRNDEHLERALNTIKVKQTKLESKFRRVLSLCLKIDEEKVDGMLDGLLQAISSEDPQDIDTDEMQDFLKKHAV